MFKRVYFEGYTVIAFAASALREDHLSKSRQRVPPNFLQFSLCGSLQALVVYLLSDRNPQASKIDDLEADD